MSFQPPPSAATSTTGTGFSFGLTSTPAAGGAAPNAPSFTFGLTGGGDAGPTFGLPPNTTATAAPVQPKIGAQQNVGFFSTPVATAAATTTAPAVAPNFTIPKSTAAPTLAVVPNTTATGGFANLSTATKTTDSATSVNATQLSYNQLEEHINKWTLELEEQEKVFTHQATQINAWDKILMGNKSKILDLNDAVQKVKADQSTLEQELEFIATQHKELEESIIPLQKEFVQIPQVDVERSQTYLLVENLDSQMKQMAEDLKEIIDSLNESNKGQDNTDPVVQIGKILNAHMSSLKWIESSMLSIDQKLEEINKLHENYKRDTERSFRKAYYN